MGEEEGGSGGGECWEAREEKKGKKKTRGRGTCFSKPCLEGKRQEEYLYLSRLQI